MRGSQSLFAIPGDGKRESAFNVAMDDADIDFLFPDTARTFYKWDQTWEEQLDCSGQELYDKILQGEIGDISLTYDVTPKIASLWAAYGMGVAASPGASAAAAATAQLTTTDIGTVGQTLIVGGVTYTIVASGPTGSQIAVGTTAADFASKIAVKVTTDTATTLCTASAVGPVVTFTRNATGTAGNGAPFSTTDTDITIDNGFQGGAAAGAVQTHAITELPFSVYQGPSFSAVFGFRDGPDPLLLTGCTLNSFSYSGKPRVKVTGQANIKFADAVAIPDFAFPDCVNEAALRFSDTKLLVNAVDQAALLRAWDLSYDNKLLTGEHGYTNAGIHVTRLERDDRRERKINYSILGDDSDAAFINAKAGDKKPIVLSLGVSPNAVIFTAPNVHQTLDGGGLAKDGQAGETSIKIAGNPLMNGAAMPLSASVINAQAAAFLVSSV